MEDELLAHLLKDSIMFTRALPYLRTRLIMPAAMCHNDTRTQTGEDPSRGALPPKPSRIR